MSDKEVTAILIGAIRKTEIALDKIDRFYLHFIAHEMKLLGTGQSSAIVIAEVMTDYILA